MTKQTSHAPSLDAADARAEADDDPANAPCTDPAGPAGPANGHPLGLVVLGSGSKGNSAVVTGPAGAILIDAGFSKKETLARMAAAGVDPASIRALIVTHEHSDHIKGVGVVSRGLKVPVLASRGTADTPGMRKQAPDLVTFGHSDELTVAGISVKVFPTSHDAADPVGFRFSYDASGASGGRGAAASDAVGYVTDTGVLTGEAAEALAGVRLLAMEANHDLAMLENGPYPYVLKRRIASETGHLSNDQSAESLVRLLTDRLEAVVAMHLSQTNNLHELPVASLTRAARREGSGVAVLAAWQSRPVVVG